MHLYILGICGTFMAGIAVLARELGHEVTGSDRQFYPPMSDVLACADVTLYEGYRPANLDPTPDLAVIGNALSRGNPEVEALLDRGLAYTSGPQWLYEHVLHDRWVIAVAGTHGKTTTTSLVAWILDRAGLEPGFLIGGLPRNFGVSARLGREPFFVVEADEYDSAFFDKRSKFVHYRPRTLVLNNLEFDHADIFPDLGAIQTQLHHLVRTVPGNGLIIHPAGDEALIAVLERGVWSETLPLCEETLHARIVSADARRFDLLDEQGSLYPVNGSLSGTYNVRNALAAAAAARHAGVPLGETAGALDRFAGVTRRMELRGSAGGIRVYDDFAHHPSAIREVLAGIRASAPGNRRLAVLELASNTMKMGTHRRELASALAAADEVWIRPPPELDWNVREALSEIAGRLHIMSEVSEIASDVARRSQAGDDVVVMSNSSFENIHELILEALRRGATVPGRITEARADSIGGKDGGTQ